METLPKGEGYLLSDGRAVSCQASLPFPTVGMRQDWLKAESAGWSRAALSFPQTSQKAANCAECFAGPIGSAFKWEVLEHEEKFSVKWSVLKTSVYYCLFWMQYSTPKAPWESEGTVCRAKRCSIPLFADIGKIRLFLLPCEQSN